MNKVELIMPRAAIGYRLNQLQPTKMLFKIQLARMPIVVELVHHFLPFAEYAFAI
jgi:hypothetical protein